MQFCMLIDLVFMRRSLA